MITLKSKLTEMETLYKGAVAKYEALIKENEALIEENKNLQEMVDTKDLKIESLVETPVNADTFQKMSDELENIKNVNSELGETNQMLMAKVSDLEKQEHDFEQRVEARSLEITQAQGVPPVDTKAVAQPAASNLDVVSQYEALTNPLEKRLFWEKHNKEIMEIVRPPKKS